MELLALEDELSMITVDAPFSTVEGPGVGSTRSDVVEAFGASSVETRTNRFQVEELLVLPDSSGAADLGVVFVLMPGTDNVEFVKTGTLDALALDEGCA